MTDQDKQLNPFQGERQTKALTSSDETRAEQEVQAAMIVAKRFPRDELAATDRILKVCTRTTLAETAMYAYPRGGSMITGPSIRLAEALAQTWGNLHFGIREQSQANGESIVEAFAWDLETNTKQVKVFAVKHKRKARGAYVNLNDPRDIYEMVANYSARRLRACILGVIPGDVVEAAVRQCEVTQANSTGVPAEEIKKLVSAFEPLGVTAEQLRKRLGHNLESTIAAEIISLRKVYTSIKDGMSAVADWFDVEPAKNATDNKQTETVQSGDAVADVNAKLNERTPGAPPPKASWPRETEPYGDTPSWVDSAGESYSDTKHAWDGEKNQPRVNQDGTFRAKPGHGKQPPTDPPFPDDGSPIDA